MRTSGVLTALLGLCCALPAAAQERVVIGSKNFPESHLLGEMLALLLEEHTELEVLHKSALGGTLVCFEALRKGGIDVYPEYTGTAWSAILQETELARDPLKVYALVQLRSRARDDVEWLAPFGFENTYALAMREERAQELGVRALSDLAGHDLTAGFSPEFVSRADGWPGLAAHYGLALRDARPMEHALAYQAVAEGKLDLLDVYSTDGKLERYDLRVLVDDGQFFPPYQAAPVARGAFLRAHPEARKALELLAYRLTAARMSQLNYEVEIERRGFREVAREFLAAEGLLAPGAAEREPGTRAQDGFLAFFLARGRATLGLVVEHVWLTVLSVLLATLLAVPLGVAVARRPWGARLSLGTAGVVQTIPSLALLAFMIAVPGLGLTARSAIAALTLYALLPILRNTVTGLSAVDPVLVDAARGLGLTERQILLRVQLPLATRTIMAGIRTATVLTIGFATLAAFIGAGGLGEPIVTGLYLNDVRLILTGALPAALLAVLADALLGRVEQHLTPRGLRLR